MVSRIGVKHLTKKEFFHWWSTKRRGIRRSKIELNIGVIQMISSFGTYSPGPSYAGGLLSTWARHKDGGRRSDSDYSNNWNVTSQPIEKTMGASYHPTVHIKQFPKDSSSFLMFFWNYFDTDTKWIPICYGVSQPLRSRCIDIDTRKPIWGW